MIKTHEENGVKIHSATVADMRYLLEESEPTPTIAVSDLKIGDYVLRDYADGSTIAYNIVEVERETYSNALGNFDDVVFVAERNGLSWVKRYTANSIIKGQAA
jgi:hypothetical protein